MELRNKDHFHGSDLEKIEARYGIRKEEITSFSDNVNPLGLSPKVRDALAEHLEVITTYPDRGYQALKESIAAYAGCREEEIIVGNGSTELISLAIRVLRPRKALLPEPTYSEYEREITLAGGELVRCAIRQEDGFRIRLEELQKQQTAEVDLLMLCNPNNPTAQAIPPADLRGILTWCRAQQIFVLMDETYVEFAPENVSAVPLVCEFDNLLILRGTSKFFAAPGLRLGYAVTGNEALRAGMRQLQNPWTIGSLAELAGRQMFRDTDYIQRSRALITAERERVCDRLSSWKHAEYFPPQANFVLVHILEERTTAAALFDHCIRKGYMIRDCSTFAYLDEQYIRFCFRLPEENDGLLAELATFLA